MFSRLIRLAIVFSFAASTAWSQIVHVVPPSPITYSAGLIDAEFDIDVNGDGLPDFAVISTSGFSASIGPLGNNRIIAVPEPPPDLGSFVASLKSGTSIGTALVGPANAEWFGNQTDQFGAAAIGAQAGFDNQLSVLGYFAGVPSSYVGFDLYFAGADHYGWLQISNPSEIVAGQIVDWAYETQQGVQIVAGATSSESFISSFNGGNQVPANTSTHAGFGLFRLEGNTLFYGVILDALFQPASARIHGPAGPDGASSHVIADFGNYTITNILTSADDPFSDLFYPVPAVVYNGSCTLSATEADELRSGRLYVSFTSAAFPRGELRGEILPNVTVQFSPTLTGRNFRPPTNSRNRAEAVIQLTGNSANWELAIDPTLALKSIRFSGPANSRRVRSVIIPQLSLIGVQIPSGGFTNAPGAPGQFLYSGGFNVTDEQAAMLRRGDFSIELLTARFPRGEIASRVVPDDSNQDGVPDYVNDFISLGVSCDGPWKNHGDYVNHVSSLAGQLVVAKEITVRQYIRIVRQAQQSACGKTP